MYKTTKPKAKPRRIDKKFLVKQPTKKIKR